MYNIRSLIPLIRHLSKICGTLLKIWPHNRKRRHMCLNLKNLFVQIELETIVLHPSYETSDLPSRGFSAASSCCWSDELYVGCTLNWEKKLVYPTYSDLLCASYIQFIGPAAAMNLTARLDSRLLIGIGCTAFVSQINNLSRSDAQLLLVGCTTFVGRMHSY